MSSKTNDGATNAAQDDASFTRFDSKGLEDVMTRLDAGALGTEPDMAQSILDRIGRRASGWESPRLQRVRAALGEPEPSPSSPAPRPGLIQAIDVGTARVALTFAGQASEYIDALAEYAERCPAVRTLIALVDERLSRALRGLPPFERALFGAGLALREWVASPDRRPSADMLAQSNVSQAFIFTTQVAALLDLAQQGLGPEQLRPVVAAGHSQGVMAAVFASEAWGRPGELDRAAELAEWFFWQGLRMHQCTASVAPPPDVVARALAEGQRSPTPMAAIAGLTAAELNAAIAEETAAGPALSITHSLENGRLRHAVSGKPEDLERLRRSLARTTEAGKAAQKRGRHGGRLPMPQWEYLPVSGAYHSPAMAPGYDAVQDDLDRLGIVIDGSDLIFPVLDPATGEPFPANGDLVPRLLELQFLRPVRWTCCAAGLLEQGATHLIDLGPGDGVMRLTAAAIRGEAAVALTATTAAGRAALLNAAPLPPLPSPYTAFTPGRSKDGLHAETAFTRFTGRAPYFLPGMTPTTVEAPLVAAAANAGYVAELAGGGQVTEAILRARLTELRDTLAPGAGVVLNTLFLDPYLWKLHCGGAEPLVCRLRAEGFPLHGVTISAGMPPVEEAAALLRTFVASGLWLNAVKPGTSDQIRHALAIADAVPELTLVIQIEGGKAGGHHSFEDLDDLLITHYAALRTRRNVIVAVGGGVGTPERGTALLSGSWSHAYGLPAMPVDAVFIGTAVMAVREAATSPAVKAALVAAPGTTRWVKDGDRAGGLTSGRSGLDAPIYYLDNAASRFSRLLDTLDLSPAALAAQKPALIAALAETAKPYFGDASTMTWRELLQRYIALAAIGRPNGESAAYSDGIWPDASWRRRFGALIRRAESRVAPRQPTPRPVGSLPSRPPARRFESAVDDASFSDPAGTLACLDARYPRFAGTVVGDDDAEFFVRTCRSPGKPANFIPVIDGELRRAFRSDALWQSHDARYPASSVLTIPGPDGTLGITAAGEPVASLFARFDAALLPTVPSGPRSAVAARAESVSSPFQTRADLDALLTEGALSDAFRARDAVDLSTGRRYESPLTAAFRPGPSRRLTWSKDDHGHLVSIALAADPAIAHGTARAAMTPAGLDAALVSVCALTGEPVALDLALDLRVTTPEGATRRLPALVWDRARYVRAQARFYGELLFGRACDVVAPFETAGASGRLGADHLHAFLAATRDDSRGLHEEAPLAMAFPLAWEAIFAALAGADCDVLSLLHEENRLEAGPAWPLRVGELYTATATITRMEPTGAGRRIAIAAQLHRESQLVATVVSRFIVRGEACTVARAREHETFTLLLPTSVERDFLTAQPWHAPLAKSALTLPLGTPLTLELEVEEEHVGTERRYGARGRLCCNDQMLAAINLPLSGAHAKNPVLEVARLLAAPAAPRPLTDARDLGALVAVAPRDLLPYALASGDLNPIHLDAAVAQYAGLTSTIVHGAFTASTALHRAVRLACDGDASRLRSAQLAFLAPVFPGESLSVRATQTAVCDGGPVLNVTVTVSRDGDEVPVLSGAVTLAAPRIVYTCPGQGIQAQSMGMNGYARSRAARAVWDDAERICREQLGFSLLDVVRHSPRELEIRGRTLVHPKGVLYLTQFTQVAMAVLAVAQVAELRERGALSPDGLFCGHSVGEYAALGAVAGVVPLAALVTVVYERGLTMDRLVARDASGASPYAMSVARPNVAGLDEAGLLALVAQIRVETGLGLEVVNFNVRGRQYSVTGHVPALDALERALVARSGGSRVAPLVRVPGVDVPFHSTLLRDGVVAFRETLRRVLPEDVAPERLVGRYLPNLVAIPFEVTREFAKTVLSASDSPEISALLAVWDETPAPERARTLLIELLAYQFASPVRWIETQDRLFDADSGVDVFVELGLAASPTVASMARATLDLEPGRLRRPKILNSEAQFEELFGPLPVAPRPVDGAVAAPALDGAVAVAPAASPSSPVVARVNAPVTDVAIGADDAVFTIIAQHARVRAEQLDRRETLEEVLGGNSARRNQVLADLGAELGGGVIDGAQSMTLEALAAACKSRTPGYSGPGAYLAPAFDAAVARALGAARIGRKDIEAHLTSTLGLGPGRSAAVLNRILLASRPGDSTRGGALSELPPPGGPNRDAALAWTTAVAERYASEVGIALTRAGDAPAGGAVVDSAALAALEARLLGPQGILTRNALNLLGELGSSLGDAVPVASASASADAARLAVYDAEHDEATTGYAALVTPVFDAEKAASFTASWAWRRRDVLSTAWGRPDPAAAMALAARLDTGSRATAAALAEVARREGRDSTLLDRLASPPKPTTLPFAGRTALVTGAGPGSIAASVVEGLLAGGARVVVTTSSYSEARLQTWKRRYQAVAAPGAELHVVPMNQGSQQDVDAAVAWVLARWVPDLLLPFAAIPESADLTGLGGRSLASFRVLVLGVERLIARIAEGYRARSLSLSEPRRCCHVILPLSPNHGLFGGDGVYGESKAALEVLLARWSAESHVWGRAVTLVGARIGWVRGTGLMHQNDALASRLEAATGLVTYSQAEMAAKLLALCDLETCERAKLAPVVADLTGGLAAIPDLGARFAAIRGELEAENAALRRRQSLDAALDAATRRPAPPAEWVSPRATPELLLPDPSDAELASFPALDHLDPRRVVAIIGYGEVGPYGSARTRWAIERDRALSLEGASELAWMTGLTKPDGEGGWLDVATGTPVDDVDLLERYEARLLAHAGIRVVEPALQTFDPSAALSFMDVHLDRDFVFPVPTREIADALVAGDPGHTELREVNGELMVLRKAGAVVKVRRAVKLDRTTVGQVPAGWDATRLGIPAELVAQVDRTTLFLLVATAEAFLAAGLEPEELQGFLHPARIGSTQSSGIGGMLKLRRLYQDFLLGDERQNDTLQETLVNVIAGWVVQGYVGSYGPMSAPVAACATAAVSVADAVDKILGGSAEVVVAGGVDDYGLEGAVGFQDMGATASTTAMAARGISPRAISRPNDRRRGGFVEAQGSGAMLLCRADVAIAQGLPVYGIVVYAGSFADGVHRSVPAPGLGALAAAAEPGGVPRSPHDACGFETRRAEMAALLGRRGELDALLGPSTAALCIDEARLRLGHDLARHTGASPLRSALGVFGMGPDDIALISTHGTSTTANDLNEAKLHQWLAEGLGRTAALPMAVISQKSLTGHPKGAAAAWQMNGLLQAMADGVVPGNTNLDDPDPGLETASHLAFTDEPIVASRERLRVALVTSLGFGHASAVVALGHPFLFWRLMDEGGREEYRRRLVPRVAAGNRRLRQVLSGRRPLVTIRTERAFGEGLTEADMLRNADVRRGDAISRGEVQP
ncbi:MAG: DUF1729 domain-containing protein [Myxococcales bacterium]|nr:DUF1729 domain-containing protein [Myxococcales bacterium]